MSLLKWIKSFFGCDVQEYEKSNDFPKDMYKVEPTLDSEQVLQELEDAVNNTKKEKDETIAKCHKEETKTKKHWYNNGTKHKLIREGDPIPKGFVKGRIKIKKECNVGKTRSKKS
jgi:FtsZ-interacting cell division protein YlmF